LSSTPIFAGSIVCARSKVANASPKRRSCVRAKPRLLSASTSRIDRHGAFEARQRLLVAGKLGQDVSAGDQCCDGIGVDLKGPFAAGHCFLVTAEILERDAAVAERIDVAGLGRQQLLVAGERFRVPAEPRKGVSAIGERAEMRRGLVQDRFVAGNGFIEPRQCGKHVATLEQRVDRTAVARQHLVEGEERVVEAPQTG
jgi:hypothetical protein